MNSVAIGPAISNFKAIVVEFSDVFLDLLFIIYVSSLQP